MTTLSHPPISIAPTPAPAREEQQFVVRNVSWGEYIKIGELFADRPALRITYDRGTLEFMSTSPRHERYKRWLGRFVETIAEELKLRIVPGGSMTFQREDLERGFELDDCFWIANEAAVREKLTWEPDKDPSPDLGLEMEVSRSALNRMAIFAAFRVPELWCYDGTELRIYLLQPDGTYRLSERSLAFPTIPVKELARFFPPAGSSDFLTAVAAVREWIRTLLNKPS
ncbi:MAG: Uma2 family endonuclease [Planctomycetes bacterium]|nr:Uma2 family endonuclease [Planctomycetota bacterium]